MFQSPRSGKFVSDLSYRNSAVVQDIKQEFQSPRSGNLYQINMDGKVFDASMTKFQSPRSGEFVSNPIGRKCRKTRIYSAFQSHRSGKFVSNVKNANRTTKHTRKRFNPLDRGNLYQIDSYFSRPGFCCFCFNPLDRGNLYLIRAYPRRYRSVGSYSFNPLGRGNLYLMRSC